MKQHLLCNILKICIHFSLIVTTALVIGCGEKENRDIIEARSAIVRGDYAAAQAAVQKTDAANQEARHLKAFLQNRTRTETEGWHQAIAQSNAYLETLAADILAISLMEDPDSDDLDRQERLVRSQNAISGLFAVSLVEAGGKRPELLSELVSHSDAAVVIGVLAAEKCYQPHALAAVSELMTKLGNGEAVVERLQQAMHHKDTAIQKEAVRYLGAMRNPELIPIFEGALAETKNDPEVAYRAIVALEQSIGVVEVGSPNPYAAIVPGLQLALRHNSAQVRMHAAKLLGRLQTETAVPDLVRLLADPNSYVKDTAIDALNRIGEPAVAPLLEVLDTGARNLIPDEDLGFATEYRYIASAYIDSLWMKKYRSGTLSAAIQALGLLKMGDGVKPLIDELKNEDLQDEALAALIEMRGVAVLPMIDALKNGTDEIRVKVADALGQIGDRRAIVPLTEALDSDPYKEVKALAAVGLGNMRARGENNGVVVALTNALSYDDTTATNAAEALGKIDVSTEDTVQKLILIAMEKNMRETLRIAALTALWRLKPQEATQPMLLLMFSDETSPVLRANAVKVLSRIQAPETIPVLLWVLSTQFDEISDFQRHMKREYKTLDTLRTQVDTFQIQWTPDYPRANYRTWGELKPIPSLVRSEVARALGIIKGDTVVEPLANALRDDGRATVRQSAAWALGEVKGDDAIPPLVTALRKDKQGAVRQEAAIALGKIKGLKVVDPLVDVLKNDKYETTRFQAAKALLEIQAGDKGLVDIIKKGLGSFDDGYEVQSVQDQVIASLIKDNNIPTAEFALDALKSAEDEWTRWALVHVIGASAKKVAVDAMLVELKNPSYVVRRRAAESLGGFKERRVVEPLIPVLENRDEMKSVRAAAAVSLGALKDERASTALLTALSDENAEIRLQAAVALGKLKDTKAIPRLSEIVEDPLEPDTVRNAAVAALGNIGNTAAEAVLMRALDVRIGDISKNAVVALGQLKSEAAVPALIAILEDKRVVLDASTDALAKASARTKAATALGEIGGTRAAEAVGRRLVDDVEYIVALEDAANRKAIGADDLKRNWSWEVFVNAAKKLDLPAFVAPKMAARAEDEWENHQVRNAAMVVLGRCNTADVALDLSQLRQRLVDPNVDIRKATALGIGQAGISGLIPELVQIMKGGSEPEKDVRRAATQGLGELADETTTDALIEVMNNDENHVEIRRDASRALGKIATDTAVTALVEKLTALHEAQITRGFRLDAIKALGDAKNSKAVTLLELILQDQDAEIHFQAAAALFEITGKGYGYNRL
ncbi:MAG: HEAT repeat domain-containing protein [Candidatus Poribacteria bacterium]|nr:HEAT repeat domain-containing protein [Candidatus Poribacteria bacterium]